MQVFLIRHAQAADETLQLTDQARPLTAPGRSQARTLGEKLRWYDCAITQVWTSPLVRAVQTAELVTAGLDEIPLVDVLPALSPDGSPREVVAALRRLAPSSSVMLFGHEPQLSSVGALLLADPTFGPLNKAEAARIVDGKLRWRFPWDADAPTPRG